MRFLLFVVTLATAGIGCSNTESSEGDSVSSRILAAMHRDAPDRDPEEVKCSFSDIIPPEVARRFGGRLYKVNSPPFSRYHRCVYLIREDVVVYLGECWPESVFVVDLDQDGSPELVVLHSVGSGVVRELATLVRLEGRTLAVHTGLYNVVHGTGTVTRKLSDQEIGFYALSYDKGLKRLVADVRIGALSYSPSRKRYWVTMEENLDPSANELIREVEVNRERIDYYGP